MIDYTTYIPSVAVELYRNGHNVIATAQGIRFSDGTCVSIHESGCVGGKCGSLAALNNVRTVRHALQDVLDQEAEDAAMMYELSYRVTNIANRWEA